jgi:hypothetical protein
VIPHVLRTLASRPRRFALFWLVLSLVLFGGAYALADISDMSESSRALMFVMLSAILVETLFGTRPD